MSEEASKWRKEMDQTIRLSCPPSTSFSSELDSTLSLTEERPCEKSSPSSQSPVISTLSTTSSLCEESSAAGR